jgi:rRNA maturation protein Nop10
MTITWECCPYCGEPTDTERIGKPFWTTTDKDGKLHVHGSTLKKCNFCGKTWHSTKPTKKEAFGYDQEDETAF